ncbi:MAG TPA: nitroreductase family protein [Aromatoleum sp.]|uniref:nitroreductase family protein n=1 Tax=Aromatoleum sp. TaxID=2307007 RepID=UPI002B474DED|nr:nitroreductase family protein [Aromatoleum sp.]HJV26874.1 nitroreductase family protein [Aromatoleum sp.]
MADRATLMEILDLARWAPSGDNTQPWRFEIVDDRQIAVHGFDTRDHVIYDLDGRASQIAHGALLETLRIAATGHGLAARWSLRPGSSDRAPIYDVVLEPAADIAPDPLIPSIRKRAVQRRMMSARPLSIEERRELVEAVGPDHSVLMFESLSDRFKVARLLWNNARLRLTCPEAYQVHRDVIEWDARFSVDRIPDQAVGVDAMTAKLMRWVMQSWERVDFFNRYLFGTVAPRIQLDFLPAMACAAHLLLLPRKPLRSIEDHVHTGEAMQRLWLTVDALGLNLQPEMTPVIFRWYVQAGRSISATKGIDEGAVRLAASFDALAGADATAPFAFFCRVGAGAGASARSLRKELRDLMLSARP